jgi:Fur family ferric uptake transcriptional regulator
MTPTDQFRRYLVQGGLKVTSERLAIVEAILAIPGHFEADILLGKLQGGSVPVSRATLYRTLNLLLRAEIVCRVTGSDGNPRYECMTGREHHDHMVCLGCSHIVEFTDERIEQLQIEACRREGFTMTDHTLRIEGCSKPWSSPCARGSRPPWWWGSS